MPIHASPGVYSETLDFSLYAPRLTTTTLALVGKTVKGPTEPTFISSVRQFIDTFGTPRKTDYSALAAISYLEYGAACWFRRLVGADATKAVVGIPTAQLKNEVLVNSVVEDNKQYIYNGVLTDDPVPGTVNIVISDPNKQISTVNIKDNGIINVVNNLRYGLFDVNTNKALSNYDNYIDYDTSNFRFTLDTTVQTKNVIVKYVKKAVNVATATIAPVTATGSTATGTIPSYTALVYKSGIKASSFVLTIVNDGNTYTLRASNEVVTPLSSTCALTCKDQSGADVDLTSSSLNLVTGEWAVEFTSEIELAELGTIFTIAYTYEIFKWKNLGTEISFTDTLGSPVSSNSIYIYEVNTTVVDEADIKIALSNEYSAIAKDDGNGNLVDIIEDSLLVGTNNVNYDTGVFSIILATAPIAGLNISVNYMSKNSYTMGIVDGTGNYSGTYNLSSSILPGSLTIKIGPNIFIDDGEGSIVKDNVIYGDVIYKDFAGNANVTFNFVGTEADDGEEVVLTFISEMGNVVAKSYGESFNGATLEFYKLDYKNKDVTDYYGLKIWTADQLSTSAPTEHFRGFTFADPDATTYFNNKVISNIVDFELYNADGNIVPVLGTKLVLSGGFDDAVDINSSTAVLALADFNNNETYDINLIAVPDFAGDKVVISELIDLCENQRGDCFAIIDPPQGLNVQNVVDWHNGDGNYANENALNSNMAALYYPWIQINNEFTESMQWVPPSVKMVSVYAYSDSNSEVWFAPAGFNRGRVFTAQRLERVLNIAERDLLYATDTNAINPICDFSGDGIVVYGQKTLQRAPTAMNRVNVVRLVLYMTKVLATAVKYLLFEPNDALTWLQYTHLVEPFMTDIKTRRGLYNFNIRCDSTTNTPSDIDNNIMVAEITIQPTKSAERIINRFKITSTGASMD